MANWMYDKGELAIQNGEIDLADDDIRALLVRSDSGNVSNYLTRTLQFVGNLTFEEAGATRVDWTMGNVTTEIVATNKFKWDNSDDITFASIAATPQTIAAMIIFKFDTNDAASPLICQISDSPFPIVATSNDIKIVFNPNGIKTIQL